MSFLVADALRLPFADAAFDLVFGSPPYCDARTYGIDAQRGCQEWVDWMLAVSRECLRVCRGPVVWVVGGVTRKHTYWPAVEGLMYRWWADGGSLYRPCIYHRVGIPGSGGRDWFRSDTEYVVCLKRPGRLPWADNTAMGGPPKYGPGGAMSHRLKNGTRKMRPPGPNGYLTQTYRAPAKVNPGNLVHLAVGGGKIGNRLAHDNEAPFPEALAEWFIRSLCPPGGVVLDPFSGSGTTVAVARRFDRRGVGSDLRVSQAELGRRRVAA